MSSFSEKINKRKQMDSRILSESSINLYSSLGTIPSFSEEEHGIDTIAVELERICRFWDLPVPDMKGTFEVIEDALGYFSDETGIMTRRVVLKEGWWRQGATPLLCTGREGGVYVLLPNVWGGYVYYEGNRPIRVNKGNYSLFNEECCCFYRPMANTALTPRDFIGFICKAFGGMDIIWLLAVSLGVGVAGLIMPAINEFIFNSVIPSGTVGAIPGISILIVGTVVIQALCILARAAWIMRIGDKMELLVHNALWGRLFTLPAGFFKAYSSGELAERTEAAATICDVLRGQLVPTLLGAVFSFIYLFQIHALAPALFLPSLGVILLVVVLNLVLAIMQVGYNSSNNRVEVGLSGLVYQLLNGLTKIKLSGSEARAFGKWAGLYSRYRSMRPVSMLVLEAMVNAVVFAGMMLIYYRAYRMDVDASQFIAFNTAFTLFVSAVSSLGIAAEQLAILKPAFEMLRPILEAVPESAGHKRQVQSLKGDINIDNIKFRYNDTMPYVIDGLGLHIKPGEYLGITGSSGCGKSTLMRVLLGFERPQSGSVYYDGQDLEGLDPRSVRRRIGVVLQDGKLFSGDIYSNIVICAPWLSLDDAWDAAERAGLAEDIENMPMGMFTMLSEDGGGLSGGQRQRLLIARAIAARPDIIMFDEATSALDNLTQATVVNTLSEMTCTRIVIAHRLSTVKSCSRIIYLDKGRIVEEGTYEELMALGGRFAQMASRQMV